LERRQHVRQTERSRLNDLSENQIVASPVTT
jgi:hypothetical protein